MLFNPRNKSEFGLSVVVNFYNMRREAPRTLYSLTSRYQNFCDAFDYEVIAIDNDSSEPLDEAVVNSFGQHFSLLPVKSEFPSPCKAINQAVEQAQYDYVLISIDGARMLSPGIFKAFAQIMKVHEHPFIYTLGMHLGHKPQNYSILEGYNQQVEDELLQTVDWQQDGYQLFTISSVAPSSKKGFFSKLMESNCIILKKEDYLTLGGYDERFQFAGGGYCNLELFNRCSQAEFLQPIMLLGEATFHQFHGGTATNVPMKDHPWPGMRKEYEEIVGEPYETIWQAPLYFGSYLEAIAPLYGNTEVD